MKPHNAVGTFLFLLAGGLSIGWLAGLASSPLLSTIMPALLTLVVGAATVLSNTGAAGAEGERSKPVLLLPIAALCAGVGAGATIGAWARYHDWLAPSSSALVDNWVALGVKREDAIKRIFDRVEPDPVAVKRSEAPSVARNGILWSADSRPCRQFLAEAEGLDGAGLRQLIEHLQLRFADIKSDIADTETLRKVSKRLCNLSLSE